MNFEAGIKFIVFLVVFGFTNYLIMLSRYEKFIIKNALNKPFKLRKYTQPTKASQKKRVEVKKKRGELKKSRQKEKHIKYE